MYEHNCFVTLTYDDAHYQPSLQYSDFQKFMRVLRKRVGQTRFFMCGEYGELEFRPHFHAILFGRTFVDGVPCGKDIFSSKVLASLWPYGFSSFGQLSYQSAAYVAGYCLKKRTGQLADVHYERLDWRTGEIVTVSPEFGHMSLKPGIGYEWFRKYWKEVYLARDGCVLKGGQTVPAPRYYDKLLAESNLELASVKEFDRYVRSRRFVEDNSPDRLLVRESVAKSRLRLKQRCL